MDEKTKYKVESSSEGSESNSLQKESVHDRRRQEYSSCRKTQPPRRVGSESLAAVSIFRGSVGFSGAAGVRMRVKAKASVRSHQALVLLMAGGWAGDGAKGREKKNQEQIKSAAGWEKKGAQSLFLGLLEYQDFWEDGHT